MGIAVNARETVARFVCGVAGQNVRTKASVHRALCKFRIAETVDPNSVHVRIHVNGMSGTPAARKVFAAQERLIAKHADFAAPRSRPVATVANGTSLAVVQAKAFAQREQPPMNPLAVATAVQRTELVTAMRIANGRPGESGHYASMKVFALPVIPMLRAKFAEIVEPKSVFEPAMVFANGVDGASGTSAKMRANAP